MEEVKIDSDCGSLRDIRGILIQITRRIGKEQWKKLDSKTRYQLIGLEFKQMREDIIRIYGSPSNYLRHWLKQKGMTKSEYCNELARRHGYRNQNAYLDKRYQLKGFKGKADRARFYRLRKKYHKSISDFDVREIQLKREKEREVKKELEDFIIIRKGMRRSDITLLSNQTSAEKSEIGRIRVVKLGDLRKQVPGKMTKVNKVNGVKPSIHPTIDVCGTQNWGVMK